MIKNSYEFCIKPPKWKLAIMLFFLFLGLLGCVLVLFLSFFNIFNFIPLGLSIFFGLLGGLGVYLVFTEKFSCENGEFCSFNGFKKKAIKVSDVSCVEIIIRQNEYQTRFFAKVSFYDKNSRKALTVSERYDKLTKNEFEKKRHLINSLIYYNIPYTLTIKETSI